MTAQTQLTWMRLCFFIIYTEDGTEKFRAQYDPWGLQEVKRNDVNFARGYCGHETLSSFQMINMNGRMYDPVLGRFLSPDNYVQMPTSSQSFNRYSYCLNNPLKYVDPDGENWFSSHWKSILSSAVTLTVTALTCGLGSGPSAAIMSGIAGGMAGGFTKAALDGNSFSQIAQTGLATGAWGGVSGFLNFASAGSNMISSAINHGITNGMLTAVQGGNMIQGMFLGAASSVSGYLINKNSYNLSTGVKIAANSVITGGMSLAVGGDFASGAILGAYSIAFNELMHDLKNRHLLFTFSSKYKENHLHWQNELREKVYRFMIARSKETGNEVAAAILENDNVLVFKDGNNTPTQSENYFINIKGKAHVRIGKNLYKVRYQVHTHPKYGTSGNPLGVSGNDSTMAIKYFEGQIHLLFLNGYYGKVSVNSYGHELKKIK